jgi:hypothetical protein
MAVCGFWRRIAVLYHSSVQIDGCAACGGVDSLWYLLRKTLMEAVSMRVVVVKSPKLLSGLLRKLFGIQRVPSDMS